jgi:WD40 repeat protein
MNAAEKFYVEGIRKIEANAAVERIHFIGDTAVFALGNSDLLLFGYNAEEKKLALFEGSLLSTAGSSEFLVAGGDDGRIIAVSPAGETDLIATDSKRRWIDHVAADADGSIAWAAGKQVFLRAPGKAQQHIDLPSTAGGLAFAKAHLGVAHYNGVTLLERREGGAQKTLQFDGMHTDISFHPEGDFVVTRMRDPALHGWCLREGGEHVMDGYSGAVRSVSWSSTGQWLASSGSRYLALWPVRQAQNPLSNVPVLLAGYRAEATAVACHPQHAVAAVGYADGAVLLIRIEDEAEMLLKNASGAPVSAMTWKSDGAAIAIGCEDGVGRIISFQLDS